MSSVIANPTESSNIESSKKECDLVMKGGITSGIVYPPLVIKLHEDGYSFRQVGGTSAGAIAAAVTAAAEHGKASGGFEKLNAIRVWLGDDRNLLNLFQPARSTAPILRTFLLYPKLKWLGTTFLKVPVALPFGNPLFFLLGALLGAALSFPITWLVHGVSSGKRFYIFLILLALLGGLLTAGIHLFFILKNGVPKNFFGICTGRGRNLDKVDETALTDWLTVNINDMAGKQKDDSPLTFGELWAQNSPRDEKKIDLRMMTSNLSQNQPYILPFNDVYFFNEEEFGKLFPPHVVAHMKKFHRVIPGLVPPPGFYLFPEARHLPVVVATRMSLSFPVLLSMVPLYTIAHNAFDKKVRFDLEGSPEEYPRIVLKEWNNQDQWVEVSQNMAISKKGLQRNWFSDGGICSNFPIHFFDAWLPTRPTFGVTLTQQMGEQKSPDNRAAAGAQQQQQVPDLGRFSYMAQQPQTTAKATASTRMYDKDVYLPQPGSEAIPQWIPIPDLPSFLGSIFSTAQNYRDNMQAMLPSYYERIVQIRLSDDEGGLNLEMPPAVIAEVVKKGSDAGEALITEFNFQKHQWVRFRVLMGQMEKALQKMADVLNENSSGQRPFDYPQLMVEQRDAALDFPYVRAKPWCDNASLRLKAIGAAINAWVPPSLEEDPPLPEPVLRVAPEI